MSWKPFRITELWAKIAYIVVAWWVLPFALLSLMPSDGVPEAVIVVVDFALSALSLSVVWLGTRAFRINGEPIEPARVWWRATGRPRAGFVLGGLFLWAALTILLLPPAGTGPSFSWNGLALVPIAAFYLHSSIRLVRGDAPVPPKQRKDDDLRLIGRKQRF